jgi:hypothetical protein
MVFGTSSSGVGCRSFVLLFVRKIHQAECMFV